MVAKDYHDSPALYANTVGRFLLDREEKALRRLDTCPFVPALVGRPSPRCLHMQFIDGRPLEELQPGELPLEALDQLEQLLETLHGKGLVHGDIGHDFTGDLGRETNFIWTGERLVLIDFAGAIFADSWPGNRWWDTLRQHDRLALTKLVCRYFPKLENHPYLNIPTKVNLSTWKNWKILGKL